MLTPSRRLMFAIFSILTLAALPLAACTSIYHRAGEEMSLDTRSRLAIRMREARSAAVTASDTIHQYAAQPQALASQVEPLSWDFSKSVASVHDVAQRLNTRGDPVDEVIAALDCADNDLAAAVQPPSAPQPNTHPAYALAADSLDNAIAKIDAYFGERTIRQAPQPTPH